MAAPDDDPELTLDVDRILSGSYRTLTDDLTALSRPADDRPAAGRPAGDRTALSRSAGEPLVTGSSAGGPPVAGSSAGDEAGTDARPGAEADGSPPEEVLARFRHNLRAHRAMLDQILLPMVRRVAPEAGETASERGEADSAALDAAVDRLGDAGRPGDPVRKPSPSALADAAADLRALLTDEQTRILPLLHRHLDADQLEDLARALHEARLAGSTGARTDSGEA